MMLTGKANPGAKERFADVFTNEKSPFAILYGVVFEDHQGDTRKVLFTNKNAYRLRNRMNSRTVCTVVQKDGRDKPKLPADILRDGKLTFGRHSCYGQFCHISCGTCVPARRSLSAPSSPSSELVKNVFRKCPYFTAVPVTSYPSIALRTPTGF